MKKKPLFAVLAALVILGGCIPVSLNSFYSDKDITFDPALVGQWGEKDDGSKVSFQQAGANAYWLIDLKADSTLKFDVHLFTLGGKRFLDLYPKSTGVVMNDLLEMHLIRAHTLLRVDQITPTLITASLSEKWLKELLTKDPKALPHVVTNDQIVLTATTAELQAFLLKYLATEGAFEKPSEMNRVETK